MTATSSRFRSVCEKDLDRVLNRLQNSRFLIYSEGAKLRKRDPSRVKRASPENVSPHSPLTFFSYTRSRPFIRIFTVARVRK